MIETSTAAAYGGPGWSPRVASLRHEIGDLWAHCGIDSEWAPLQAVLLQPPGLELAQIDDPNRAQMLDRLDPARSRAEHDALAQAYRDGGVTVHYVEPDRTPPPNLMFVADLLLMTPEGAIVGRPASTVRAGEERFIARRLAELGIPILRTVRGNGTFEGADAAWLDPRTVLLATGLRTNKEGAAQVAGLLGEMGIEVIHVGLPYGAMHLMGTVRFAGPDLAIAWPGRVPYAAVEALRARGYAVLFSPVDDETRCRMALNFVTLGPRRILTAADCPVSQHFFEDAGIACHTVVVNELAKAAGGIGCMTGIIERKPAQTI